MTPLNQSGLRRTSALAAVRPAGCHDDDERLVEIGARVLFSLLAEPGDGVLGRVVAALGAATTADYFMEQASVEHFAEALSTVAPSVLNLPGSAGYADAPGSGGITAEELRAGWQRWMPRLTQRVIERNEFDHALLCASAVGAQLLVPGDPMWPVGLDELGVHAPWLLWVRGRATALSESERSIAVVGARAASGYGEQVAAEASAGLVDRGFTIVSGGAYGIDGVAHRAALASEGVTVAFLAGGIDRFYPSGHEKLLSHLVATGAVMAETPCGTAPTKWRFLQRNRLIAAASHATVVVEAGYRSGALNTAAHAADLGRPLGAVPGPVTSASSVGCHRILREYGAVCVTNAAQMAELGGLDLSAGGVGGRRNPDECRTVDALDIRRVRSVENIAERAGLSVATVTAILGVLDIHGVAEQREEGWRLTRTHQTDDHCPV